MSMAVRLRVAGIAFGVAWCTNAALGSSDRDAERRLQVAWMPTCTGNEDAVRYPDITCDGGDQRHLNTLRPNSDTIAARSPECCCTCDSAAIPVAERMEAWCVRTTDDEEPDAGDEANRCTDIMRHYCGDDRVSCNEHWPFQPYQDLADMEGPTHSAQELCMGDNVDGSEIRYECTYIARRQREVFACPHVECTMPIPPPLPMPELEPVEPVPEPEPEPEPDSSWNGILEPDCPTDAPRMCSGNCDTLLDVVHAESGYGCELYFPFPSIPMPNITDITATDDGGGLDQSRCCRDPCEDVVCPPGERRSNHLDFEVTGMLPSWEYARQVPSADEYATTDCCTNRPDVEEHVAPEIVYCTGNNDPRYPDVVCDGSQHGLNNLRPNSDEIPGRSPYCCCYCDGKADVLLSSERQALCDSGDDQMCNAPFAYCVSNDDARDVVDNLQRVTDFIEAFEISAQFQHATHAENKCTDAMRRVRCDDGEDPEECEENRPFPTFTERADKSRGQDICLQG